MDYNLTSTTYEAPTTPSIEFLKSDDSLYRIFGTGVIIEPDTHLNYGIASIKGKDNLRPHLYTEVFRSLGTVRSHIVQVIGDYSSPILDLLNVKYVLIKSNEKIQDYDSRYNLVFEDKSVKILENQNVLPRSFMVYNYQEIPSIELPKNWSNYQFLKGWLKGDGKNEPFEFRIFGPTKDDFVKFVVINESKDWKEFVLDLNQPDEKVGNPDLTKVIELEISGPHFSDEEGWKIKELQISKGFFKIT